MPLAGNEHPVGDCVRAVTAPRRSSAGAHQSDRSALRCRPNPPMSGRLRRFCQAKRMNSFAAPVLGQDHAHDMPQTGASIIAAAMWGMSSNSGPPTENFEAKAACSAATGRAWLRLCGGRCTSSRIAVSPISNSRAPKRSSHERKTAATGTASAKYCAPHQPTAAGTSAGRRAAVSAIRAGALPPCSRVCSAAKTSPLPGRCAP